MLAHRLLKAFHPKLRLSFLDAAGLDARWAFTRATAANYFGADGAMHSASSGVARFEFNRSTLAPLGLLLEDARTNICLRSDSPGSASWTKTNVNGSSNSQTGLDGTSSFGAATATAGNGTILQTITVVNGSTYTFSIWLKRLVGTGNIQVTTDNGTTWNTLAVTSTLTEFTQSQVASSTSMVVGLRIVTNADSVVFGGAQLELGAYATSPLSTAGTSTARNADLVTSVLPAPYFSGGGPFSMLIEGQMIGLSGSTKILRVATAIPSANNTAIGIDGSGNVTVSHTVASSTTSSGTIATLSVGAIFKAALSYDKTYGLQGAVNGAVGTSSPVIRPTERVVAMTALDFGPATATASMYVRRLNFWPCALNPDRLALATAL
jgi:hypothetical protein